MVNLLNTLDSFTRDKIYDMVYRDQFKAIINQINSLDYDYVNHLFNKNCKIYYLFPSYMNDTEIKNIISELNYECKLVLMNDPKCNNIKHIHISVNKNNSIYTLKRTKI